MSEALFGVYPGLVADVKDPDSQGRVKIRLPWLDRASGRYEAWARLATLMAGSGRGAGSFPILATRYSWRSRAATPRSPM